MLYKFKSDASGDVIMLEATGRQVLEIIGKGSDGKGILLPEQMADAITALKAAIQAEVASEESQGETAEEASSATNSAAQKRIGLRTRAWPLVTLIERSLKANVPITWGV